VHPLHELITIDRSSPVPLYFQVAQRLQHLSKTGEVAGVASPILAPDGEVLAALSVSGQAGRINLARVDAAVRTAALAIAQELALGESIVRPVLGRSLSTP
jgi:DNA-binding IclR family transcriptional regulator